MKLFFTTLALCLVAVCATGTWSVVQDQFATIAMATAFTSSTNGIAPIADNGEGSFVLQTTNGGSSWTQVAAPQALSFLGADAQANSAVVSDMFSLYFSDSPVAGTYNFTSAALTGGVTSQNVEAFAGTYYGATGNSLFGGNGVAVSADSGAIFTFINISTLQTNARYGAFPSTTTWYISAGTWPNNNNNKRNMQHPTSFQLNSRITMNTDASGKPSMVLSHNAASPAVNEDGWSAQIVKTTDGGKTWQSVFLDEGHFYFNQISCATEDHCVAVGEADNTSPTPGIRIYTTTDGGENWSLTFSSTDATMSIMAVEMLNTNEVWAAGGQLSDAITGYFWHSTDGGKTWTPVTLDGVYTVSLSFPSSSNGFATAMNAESTCSFLSYQ